MNERRLLAGILLQAVKDARNSDPELSGPARRWLRKDGADWAELLDISPERVTAWVDSLPGLPREQLVLFEW